MLCKTHTQILMFITYIVCMIIIVLTLSFVEVSANLVMQHLRYMCSNVFKVMIYHLSMG